MNDGRLIIDQDVELKPGSRILDSGTGTGEHSALSHLRRNLSIFKGAWILSLAHEVPASVELVGVDVSGEMLPDELPGNFSFIKASVTSLPETWTNSFDFINQRLLVGALSAPEWTRALSELLRVLKPGGYAQLLEFSIPFSSSANSDLPMSERLTEFHDTLKRKRNKLRGFATRLPELAQEAGFIDVKINLKPIMLGKSWGEIGTIVADSMKLVYRSIGATLMADGGLGLYKSSEDVNAVVDAAREEWDEKEGVHLTCVVITGRKPL